MKIHTIPAADEQTRLREAGKAKRVQALLEVRENMAFTLEFITIEAELARAKYLALLKQGFTEAQAIELCKKTL
jgi:hypothetical protein